MKELYHLLVFVTILITNRADAVPERNRREEDRVPVGGQVGDYGGTSINLNTEALLSDKIAKGGADEYQSSKAFSEIQTGKKTQNSELVQADATGQSKLQAQFEQGTQYGEEIEADFKENQGVKFSKVPTVLPPTQGIMQFPYGITPGSQLNYGLVGSVHHDNLKKIKSFTDNSMLVPYSKLLNRSGQEPGSLYAIQSNTVPSNPTNAYEGPFVGTIPQSDRGIHTISHTGPVSTPNQQTLPISITGYDVTQSPDWVGPPNVIINNKNWNLYTKPAEGETLVQVDGVIQSGGKTKTNTEVQENSKQTPNLTPYQNGNPPNVYDNNKNWNPYTKPAEGETLVQVDGDIQSGGKTEADPVVQENGKRSPIWIPYQNGTPNLSALQTNVVSPNTYNINWNPYTKPAEGETLIQSDTEIQDGGKTYANTVHIVQDNGKENNNWVPYQKGNSNKSLVQTDVDYSNSYDNNWNPFTKPGEGEILVQADGEIQNGEKLEAAQENGKLQYQKAAQANSVVQTNKGLEVTNEAAKTFARYGGHYNSEIQPTLMGQINSEKQNERSTQTNILVRSNGGFQYSGENKRTDAETQANMASSSNGGSPHNWKTQYLTAAQIKKGIMNRGAKKSESSLPGKPSKYNGGYINGGGFLANTESHLENGAQFGAAVAGNTLVQAGSVVEARFSQTTSRRPFLAFGHPLNRWHHG